MQIRFCSLTGYCRQKIVFLCGGSTFLSTAKMPERLNDMGDAAGYTFDFCFKLDGKLFLQSIGIGCFEWEFYCQNISIWCNYWIETALL